MVKKIAVLVRDRQAEALRMSLGMTLSDDAVDVFVLDGKLEETGSAAADLELMRELEMNIYTNLEGTGSLEYLPTDEVALRLLHYDHVVAY
jgi:hypothetical protein